MGPQKKLTKSRTSSSIDATSTSDAEWVLLAEEHYTEQRHLKAAECLRLMQDQSLWTEQHRRILEMADQANSVLKELRSPNPTSHGWKKQGERLGDHHIVIYYRVQRPENIIVCRVETPIETSLLCPLISVFNETQLYHTWMPHWTFPVKLGLSASERLHELARGHQIIRIQLEVPYPFKDRELYLQAFAVDSIDDDRSIIIQVDSMDAGKHFEMDIPELSSKLRRAELHAGMLIRPCPPDHPCLQNQGGAEGGARPEMLLFSTTLQADGRVTGVPLSIINFVTRHAVGAQWGALLQVAEDVRQGRRPEHQNAIAAQPELYAWVEERVRIMLREPDPTSNVVE
jgi:hypothetical protein